MEEEVFKFHVWKMSIFQKHDIHVHQASELLRTANQQHQHQQYTQYTHAFV